MTPASILARFSVWEEAPSKTTERRVTSGGWLVRPQAPQPSQEPWRGLCHRRPRGSSPAAGPMLVLEGKRFLLPLNRLALIREGGGSDSHRLRNRHCCWTAWGIILSFATSKFSTKTKAFRMAPAQTRHPKPLFEPFAVLQKLSTVPFPPAHYCQNLYSIIT